MHNDWVVCAFVSLIEAQLVIGEHVDPMLADEPVKWSSWHAQEPCAVGVISFWTTRAPKRHRTRGHDFWVTEHVCNGAFCSSVEVSVHDVDLEKLHVRV